MNLNFKRHFLLAALFFLGALVFIAARNWEAVSTMWANATAVNEGGQVAAKIRSPDDFLNYLAEHPEQASLVAFDVDAPEAGVAFGADRERATTGLARLVLAAEAARRMETGDWSAERPVSLDSVAAFALPGVTKESHTKARTRLVRAEDGAGDALPLASVVAAAVRHNDGAAADWLAMELGAETVQGLPAAWGLDAAGAPRPLTGTYLSWTQSGEEGDSRTGRMEAVQARNGAEQTRRSFAWAERLQTDTRFRQALAERLAEGGSDLSLAQQRDFARASSPTGTAADYAAFLARVARGDAGPGTKRLQAMLERSVSGDSTMTLTHVAARSGAYPGLLSFAAYARRTNGPDRVLVLLMEDVPLAVLYHLLQTGIDKGFQLQVLSDDAYLERVGAVLREKG